MEEWFEYLNIKYTVKKDTNIIYYFGEFMNKKVACVVVNTSKSAKEYITLINKLNSYDKIVIYGLNIDNKKKNIVIYYNNVVMNDINLLYIPFFQNVLFYNIKNITIINKDHEEILDKYEYLQEIDINDPLSVHMFGDVGEIIRIEYYKNENSISKLCFEYKKIV